MQNLDEIDFGSHLEIPDGCIKFDGGEKDDGLITANGVFPEQFSGFGPFERVLLLAHGNLQSTISAWFAKSVVVEVVRNEIVESGDDGENSLFDRLVNINCGNSLFCIASSAVRIKSRAIFDKVQSNQIGLGQLFRSLDTLPRFTLRNAGRLPDGGIWRLYDLVTPLVATRIIEKFPKAGIDEAVSLLIPPSSNSECRQGIDRM